MSSKTAHLLALSGSCTCAVLILWLTLTPQAAAEINSFPVDKLAHMVAFAVYALPTALLFPRALVPTLFIGLILGGGIEIIQPFFARAQELADFCFDVVGLIFGAGIGLGVRALFRVVKRQSSVLK